MCCIHVKIKPYTLYVFKYRNVSKLDEEKGNGKITTTREKMDAHWMKCFWSNYILHKLSGRSLAGMLFTSA